VNTFSAITNAVNNWNTATLLYCYAPVFTFGSLVHSTGTTPNNYLYSGEQYDPDLHLYYNRARYLNVSTGRFWSMDSFEGNDRSPLALHKYLYDLANPVNVVDPSGNESLTELAETESIGEVLDTQVTSPTRALRLEADAKIADVYFVFGLGSFGGGGKFAGIPFFPIPHAYVYANIRALNEGERFDVGLAPEVYSTSTLLKSVITTVPGVVNIDKTNLAAVKENSLFMRSWASLSFLELGLWRAGLPALASEITTGLQSLFPPSSFSGLDLLPYSVLGEGSFNCITFSLAAVGAAKALEKAPI
jgi:RHS repeat-associated protein